MISDRGQVKHPKISIIVISSLAYLYNPCFWSLSPVLGQIDFVEKSSDSGAHECEARDARKLVAPAKMLGVTASELGQHLTHRQEEMG